MIKQLRMRVSHLKLSEICLRGDFRAPLFFNSPWLQTSKLTQKGWESLTAGLGKNGLQNLVGPLLF